MTDDMIGSIWRDTYDDRRRRNLRTIRIVELLSDGRWLAETLTHPDGAPLQRPRTTKLRPFTLAAGYERLRTQVA